MSLRLIRGGSDTNDLLEEVDKKLEEQFRFAGHLMRHYDETGDPNSHFSSVRMLYLLCEALKNKKKMQTQTD